MTAMLFTPIRLGPATAPNRISIPPMCTYSSKDGIVQKFHLMHYGSLAASGAGILCIESTGVTPDARLTPWDLGLWSDDQVCGFKELVDFMRELAPGCKILVQLNHAGRKASCRRPWELPAGTVGSKLGGWKTRAPSPIAFGPGYDCPREMDAAECPALAQAFAQAALRAVVAGVDGIELHAAHGYLMHQFLSPLSNHRTDAYGGSLEGRMRFPLEVMAAVRAAVPQNVALGLRVSATDWLDDGWSVDETVELVRRAEALGLDFCDVSTGGNTPDAPIPVGPGYQLPMARRVKEAVGIPVFAVGLITDGIQAETILRAGGADVIDVGRAMLDDARWGWHAARALGLKEVAGVAIPPQYRRGLML